MEETPTPNPMNPMPEGTPEPTPAPAPQPEMPAASQPAVPAEPAVPTEPAVAATEPLAVNPVPTPAPEAAAAPAPAAEVKKELTPEEKKAKRKAALKRLALVSGITYLVLLLAIVAWAFVVGEKEIATFNYLPVSQSAFSGVLMTLFNVMVGVLVGASLCSTAVGVLKSLLAKKDQIEKKKKASRLALFSGIGFFVLTVLWLAGITVLGPRLVLEERFESPIQTTPELTLGLTAPVDVIFDARSLPIDTGTYQILSYTWSFGDGETANGEVVSHRFTSKGTADGRYTVMLDVDYMDLKSGEQFSNTFEVEVSIENELVAAYFTATPDSGEIPLSVSFDASGSYDPDGEIIAYEWDLDGDGRFDDAEGVEAEYEYNQEGEFEVSLRVTDSNGEYDVMTSTIEAGSVGGLRAVIEVEDAPTDDLYYVGEKYSFTGELSQIDDGNISKYTWDFGDGTTVQSRSTSHTYEESGDYTIILTVQDPNGNSDQATLDVTVIEEGTPPSPSIETSPALENGVVSGPVPLTVTFDATDSTDSDDDIVDYEWDFDGDGLVDDTGDKATYTYEEVGNYEAQLILTDSVGNKSDTTVDVEVTAQGILANLQISQSNGEVPLTVTFDASASSYKEGSIVSYEYDFGDGTDVYVGGSSVTYKYNSVGTFSASVTVLGDDGETDTATVQIVVRPVAITACFTVNTDSGSAPLFVTVDPSCSQGTIKSYEWDFGDGEISFDRKPDTHVYSDSGVYTISLEVTSDEGIVDLITKSITVK